MSHYQSDLLRLLDERGYIHQLTDAQGLDALAARGTGDEGAAAGLCDLGHQAVASTEAVESRNQS